MSTLCFYINTSDEDGPYFSYLATNYKSPSNKTKIVCTEKGDVLDFVGKDRKWVSSKLPFDYIFESYNIRDIFEVHDWYDVITRDEAVDLEKKINNYDIDVIKHEGSYQMVTVIEYIKFPVKYVIPIDYYKEIILTKSNLNLIDQYRIKSSYNAIMSNYHIIGHDVIVL
jgi:hypothetical protein